MSDPTQRGTVPVSPFRAAILAVEMAAVFNHTLMRESTDKLRVLAVSLESGPGSSPEIAILTSDGQEHRLTVDATLTAMKGRTAADKPYIELDQNGKRITLLFGVSE